jgi:hypothetical protein
MRNIEEIKRGEKVGDNRKREIEKEERKIKVGKRET